MTISLPDLSLVVLIGASGSGKSTFAATHFLSTEVVSSDACRAMIADDPNDQAATPEAFDVLQYIVGKRLAGGRLTVVDATNVQREARKPLIALAREYHCIPVAIVLDVPERVCHERNRARPDRAFGPHVVRRQSQSMRRSLRGLQREGFRHIFVLKPDDIQAAVVERHPLHNDKRAETGPFDIVGDVHGCHDELVELLALLGYERSEGAWRNPDGRRAVFLGDLVDRGPRSVDVVLTVKAMVDAGTALAVPGNHDMKLVRKLRGRDVRITHGLADTLADLERHPPETADTVRDFLDSLVSHYVLDGGRLVVAHAGMREQMQGRGSGKVRAFALYGETTGETDELGMPVRWDWASSYRGEARVVYGHTPVSEPEWVNRTINIDTGCAFGGRLTALRYPELEIVSVPARAVYHEPIRLLPAAASSGGHDDLLDLADLTGRRIISTRLMGNLTLPEELSAAALEVMSRFAVDPRWLVYLPPTMSPSETTSMPGLLEHPAETFAYFRNAGVPKVVCEAKHMGSRAVIVACREPSVSRTRFGVPKGPPGAVYTRTGRPFFQRSVEEAVLTNVCEATDRAGLWDELSTDWVVLDAEIMPWSAKAQDLIRTQYAATGAAARASLTATADALRTAPGADELLSATRQRLDMVESYVDAYRRYCWAVSGAEDLRIAPFHVLASEGSVHLERDHAWHMQTASRLAGGSVIETSWRVVDTTDPGQEADAVSWWEDLVASGGEGMVVKPLDPAKRGKKGLVQPALKCRGPEYLRIIYGPEYTAHLDRLRTRSLGRKRSLALREFALGAEALHRFVEGEPLRRVHECVYAVLALESEPVDPRL